MARGGGKKKKRKSPKTKKKPTELATDDVINFTGFRTSFSSDDKEGSSPIDQSQSSSSSSSSSSKEDIKQDDSIESSFRNASPFPHLRLENFIPSDVFLKEVMEELFKATQNGNATKFTKRSNDLYDFQQSDELANCTTPSIVKLRDALYSQKFRDFIEKVTGIKTTPQVDMTASLYRKRNRLLCHDDQLDSRRIAYILYLTPNWEEADGGSLDLFNSTEDDCPSTVAKSFVPIWNSLAFFEVSSRSHHQVAEVLTAKNRLTVGGWFHGEPLESKVPPSPSNNTPFTSPQATDEKVEEWIAPKYLKEGIDKQILDKFMEEGSVELENFLKSDKYSALIKALQENHIWELVGPANRNHYYRPSESSGFVQRAQNFLSSSQFGELLKSWTNLDVTEVSGSVRRFDKSCYTLCSDVDQKEQTEGLDCILCCSSTDRTWTSDHGGTVYYLDSEQELLSVTPSSNSLSLVYREDGEIMQFVEYVTNSSKSIRFDIKTVFHVAEGDSDDDIVMEDEDEEEMNEGEDESDGENM